MNIDKKIYECLARGISQDTWDKFNQLEREAYVKSHPTSKYAQRDIGIVGGNTTTETPERGDCVSQFNEFLKLASYDFTNKIYYSVSDMIFYNDDQEYKTTYYNLAKNNFAIKGLKLYFENLDACKEEKTMASIEKNKRLHKNFFGRHFESKVYKHEGTKFIDVDLYIFIDDKYVKLFNRGETELENTFDTNHTYLQRNYDICFNGLVLKDNSCSRIIDKPDTKMWEDLLDKVHKLDGSSAIRQLNVNDIKLLKKLFSKEN